MQLQRLRRCCGCHTASGHPSVQQAQLRPASRAAAVAVRAAAGQEVKLYYRSSWGSGRVHGSVQGGDWKDYELRTVTSAPGKWLSTSINLNGSSSSSSSSATAPAVEFVVTDGGSQWDKPPQGGNYVITVPGTYTLTNGSLSQLPAAAPPPVMLVSDLDGTMVGNDAATAAFKAWWENEGLLRGGTLVYNTGRALDSFKQLLRDKAHCLAHPDVLISAVGTKVYNFTPSSGWQEDKGWANQLEVGWRVEAVREAAYAALANVGKDVMHFRPPDEQNDHKVTCGVNVCVLQRVLDQIHGALDKARVQANIIVSGTGDWRFLDLVPVRAGKLQALEYVRASHRFPLSNTIACGDSGNDILMLSGRNLAIVVGNAQPDLLQWLEQHVSDESPLPGKQRLLRTEAHEAYGILEGLEYFGLK
ncbi:sucrose-6F-phosphate phosphohydrolase-domain-containing protein [Scenedesmus sp. NREL 46B-D3]|nr:sucrose-6F-phosphate phosphohydrolase-domain-containing protein [Scenedesmus sp. NREL 46B-D3]